MSLHNTFDRWRFSNAGESRLNTRLFEDGIVEFGIPAYSTVLHGAMSFAGVEIVEMLLKKGADPYIEEKNGMDCLMLASTLGRAENVTFWLSRFKDWDVNRGLFLNGATGSRRCHVCFNLRPRGEHQTLAITVSSVEAS